MPNTIESKIVRSALWAAYGDILGFPTELISENDFLKRTGKREVRYPIAWSRRQGGLFGPTINFHPGSYSDDTQLRLSTCRAIRGNGYFDVESFAKIELPVWLNYALGAGRGSKAAAANLALKESTWSQNFFSNERSVYWHGGGNGAAMRIQPHVWAGYKLGLKTTIGDVVRNSICTHGHPRAIIGAAIHACSLLYTIKHGHAPTPDTWADLGIDAASIAYECLVEDAELSLVWIPKWELSSKSSLKDMWAETISEWVSAAHIASQHCLNISEREQAYKLILNELGGFTGAERGSGLKTSLYANALAWLYKGDDPLKALLLSANTFNSDTDTIASMTGAIVGVVAENDPKGPIQDESYIKQEALRLSRIANGQKEKSFEYPDLIEWHAPRNQSDAWNSSNTGAAISGLGKVKPIGDVYSSQKGIKIDWQWCELSFGQRILAKRRAGSLKEKYESPHSQPSQGDFYHMTDEPKSSWQSLSLDEITQHCIRSGFDAKLIGEALLYLTENKNGIEKAIAFSAIIAKAKIARSHK